MCGIVGYVGDKSAVGIIVEGLKRLEYRGYDSAGVAVLHRGRPARAARRRPDQDARGRPRRAAAGRRARHRPHAVGDPRPSLGGERPPPHRLRRHARRRPQRDHRELPGDQGAPRSPKAHRFQSQTDTEVLAHLIEHHLKTTGRLDRAVKAALNEVTGAPTRSASSRRPRPTGWSPPSTAPAASSSGSARARCSWPPTFPRSSPTRATWSMLEDDEVAVVTADAVELSTLDGEPVQRRARCASCGIRSWPRRAATGTSCSRRCYEQPRAITDTFRGRIAPETGNVILPDVNLDPRRRARHRAGGPRRLRHRVPRRDARAAR